MKTGSINLRVVDFLKKFPPFSFLSEEDLTELAANGRVAFHEAGETLYEEGDPEPSSISVIQQGAVRVVRQKEHHAVLLDMLGEGDLLGMGALVGRLRHRAGATAVRDTILYVFEAELFRRITTRASEARRFLSAYLALAPSTVVDVEEIESADHTQAINWMEEHDLKWDHPHCAPLTCTPETAIRLIASEMRDQGREAAVVCDGNQRPLGIVTSVDLSRRAATGEFSLDAPVSLLMSSPVESILPDFSLGSCLLTMMRRRCRHLCVTEDGTPQSRLLAIISERNLMLYYGNNPLLTLREIDRCRSVEELAPLRKRIDALLQSSLLGPESVDWCSELIGEATRSLVAKVVQVSEDSLTIPKPDNDFTYLLIGSAGRSELLTRTDLAHAVLYDDPSPTSEVAVERYLETLAAKVREGLGLCGYTEIYDLTAGNLRWRQSESVWQRIFSAWIREPLHEDILKVLSFFDFAPVTTNHRLAETLRDFVHREIRANKRFLPILANDVLRVLPPVTVFEGDIIDTLGVVHDRLHIKELVTQPIAEAARVFALSLGEMHITNTVKRLELAAKVFPNDAEIFRKAAGAYRVGLYFRAISGLRHFNDGAIIEPNEFSRGDQLLLKNSFRVVADFQEHAAKHFGLRN